MCEDFSVFPHRGRATGAAVDEERGGLSDGRGLVWTGEARPTPTPGSPLAADQTPVPRSYTLPYLAQKILTSKAVLEGECKRVTVLFAGIKGATELIRGLDPEAAQRLLDPALHRMMDSQ